MRKLATGSRGEDSHDISGNGTVGANTGHGVSVQTGKVIISTPAATMTTMTAVTVQRAKLGLEPLLRTAGLTLFKSEAVAGEDYLNSDIFDGFNYIGSSVSTDDQMLPPNLRGYAPDVSGVAHSSAKSPLARWAGYFTKPEVPAGPFRIQDIGDSVSGTLHVRVEEQNGQVQEYDVTTASMPFLTRRGRCVTK